MNYLDFEDEKAIAYKIQLGGLWITHADSVGPKPFQFEYRFTENEYNAHEFDKYDFNNLEAIKKLKENAQCRIIRVVYTRREVGGM